MGQLPFRGATAADTQSAILTKPAPPVPLQGESISSEASSELQRIVDKCLAKDPAERYQGIKDLILDLRGARRRLETGSVPVVVATRPTKRAPLVLAELGLLALVNRHNRAPPQQQPVSLMA